MVNIIDLQGKRILITGAASGIGRETAVIASRLGATVCLVDLSEVGLQGTFSLLVGEGHEYKVMDLTDLSAIAPYIKSVTENNRLHGLVHCAGISSRKPLNVLTREGFAPVMDVNFYSFVEVVRQACKKKHFAEGGSVVVMSSISSIRGFKAKTEYCVSKAAVDSFVRCTALELADRKIRINSVMAAEVATPLAAKAKLINQTLGVQDFVAPLGPSEAYEIANTICFLLSDATRTITGTSILIDGGACV